MKKKLHPVNLFRFTEYPNGFSEGVGNGGENVEAFPWTSKIFSEVTSSSGCGLFVTSQPGKLRTAEWHCNTRARTFTRSTPRLVLPCSIAEIGDWRIAVILASSV
jgi:hypothetical protein